MARYSLSQVADGKISAVYEYSLLQFGEDQADDYFLGMHHLFEILAERPLLGRQSDALGEGMRRFVYKAHVVFYTSTADGILVVDIFGIRQMPRLSAGAASSDED